MTTRSEKKKFYHFSNSHHWWDLPFTREWDSASSTRLCVHIRDSILHSHKAAHFSDFVFTCEKGLPVHINGTCVSRKTWLDIHIPSQILHSDHKWNSMFNSAKDQDIFDIPFDCWERFTHRAKCTFTSLIRFGHSLPPSKKDRHSHYQHLTFPVANIGEKTNTLVIALSFHIRDKTLLKTHQAKFWISVRVSCAVEILNSDRNPKHRLDEFWAFLLASQMRPVLSFSLLALKYINTLVSERNVVGHEVRPTGTDPYPELVMPDSSQGFPRVLGWFSVCCLLEKIIKTWVWAKTG